LETQIRFGPITDRGPVFTSPFLVDLKKTLCGKVTVRVRNVFGKKKRLKYVFGATRTYRFWTLYFRLTLTSLYIGTGVVHYLPACSPLKSDAFFPPFLYSSVFFKESYFHCQDQKIIELTIQYRQLRYWSTLKLTYIQLMPCTVDAVNDILSSSPPSSKRLSTVKLLQYYDNNC